MAPWVKDLVWLLQWLQLLLWHGFNPWRGNFHMSLGMPPPQKKRKRKEEEEGRENSDSQPAATSPRCSSRASSPTPKRQPPLPGRFQGSPVPRHQPSLPDMVVAQLKRSQVNLRKCQMNPSTAGTGSLTIHSRPWDAPCSQRLPGYPCTRPHPTQGARVNRGGFPGSCQRGHSIHSSIPVTAPGKHWTVTRGTQRGGASLHAKDGEILGWGGKEL